MFTVVALYSFSTSDPTELSFNKNDKLLIIDDVTDKNWWKAELNGKIGSIPSNYVV